MYASNGYFEGSIVSPSYAAYRLQEYNELVRLAVEGLMAFVRNSREHIALFDAKAILGDVEHQMPFVVVKLSDVLAFTIGKASE